MVGIIYFYESRTHNVQIALNALGWCEMKDYERPEHYWILDWTTCIRKLNYDADVAFLGNSITAGSDFQQFFKDCKVVEFGHCGDRVDGLMRRVAMVQAVKPEKLFIMAGINDLHRSSPRTIAKRYAKLLKLMKDSLPNTRIYVQSILPVNHAKEKLYASNKIIQETNSLIRECANKHHCIFIDLHSLYIENGVLPDSLSLDGVHLKPTGYGRWADAIRPYIYE